MRGNHRGIEFIVQATKEGFLSIVALESGPVICYNLVTGKPCSSYRSCLFFTKRFIKNAVRGALAHYKKTWVEVITMDKPYSQFHSGTTPNSDTERLPEPVGQNAKNQAPTVRR